MTCCGLSSLASYLTQQQAKEKQQELREAEANNEAKDEEKYADVRIAEDIQNMQKAEADKKRKQAQDQAQAIGNPNLLRRSGRRIPHGSRARQPRSTTAKIVGTEAEGEGQTSRTAILRRK